MAGESFRVVSGNAAGTQIQLGDEFQIGRSADTEGRLGDDPELSRAHAKVTRDPQGRLVVQDLGSTNGTAVNGQRISGPTVLKPGDTVQVGKSTLQLQDASGGAPQATALGSSLPPAAAAPPPPSPPTAPTQPLVAGAPGSGAPGGPQSPPPAFGGGPVGGGGPIGGGLPPGGPGRPGAAGDGGGGGKRALLIVLGLLAVAGVVVAVLLLAGGGDDGGGEEEDVRAAVSSFFENDCDVLTDDFREELYGEGEGDPEENCEEEAGNLEDEEDFEIAEVTIDGDTAEAAVEVDGEDAELDLEKDGEEWKVDGVSGDVAQAQSTPTTTTPTTPTTPETTTPAPEPEPEPEPDPRETEAIATLQALIDAIKENDEKVFCGLLSPRQAQKLVGGPGGDAAIARCVQVAKNVDLGEGVPDEIDVTGVRVTGNKASVRLTTGERFTLVRRGGRYVINSGLG